MSNHEWCRNVPRDEAVRAAEDAAAVPSIQHRDLPEVVAALTERVAELTTKHNALADLARLDAGWLKANEQRLTAERDAARARVAELEAAAAPAANAGGYANNPHEPESLPEQLAYMMAGPFDKRVFLTREEVYAYRRGLSEIEAASMIFVPLYAAPQPPRGWLTAEERGALKRAFDLLCDDDGDQPLAGTVQQLLARSSPPMVRRPEYQNHSRARDCQWIAAIRAAGGEVANE